MAKKEDVSSRLYRESENRRRAAERADKNKIVAMDGGKSGGKYPLTYKNQRNTINKSLNIMLLWGLIFLLFVVYVCGYTYSYLTRERIRETKIVYGSVDSPIITTGVIIRDEIVYKSAAEGITVYGTQELTRVKKGDILCSIEDEAYVAELESQSQSLDLSMMGIQAGREDLSIFGADIEKANLSIKKIIDSASFKHTAQDITQIYALAGKLQDNVDFRNKILLSEDRRDLRSYSYHKEYLASQLSDAKLGVYANQTGIFSTRLDNYEGIFTFDTMESLSKEKTLIDAKPTNLTYERNVTKDTPIFKIIHSNDWYIAAYVPTELVEGWEERSVKTIYIEIDHKFEPLEVTVHKIDKVSSEDGERYVLLKCTKYMTDYLDYRSIRFKIIQNVNEGYKIPVTSIVEKTLLKIPVECVFKTTSTIMVIKRTTTASGFSDENIPITFTQEDDNYVYVILDYNKLALGDTLMVNSKPNESRQITEIENVKGIYVTNSGSAVFRKIVIDGQFSSNSEYIVLNPDVNKNLKVHDKIVLDIRNVSERQMVY